MADTEVTCDGHVMVVTMNRPQRKNAMTPAMVVGLADAWARLDADDELRCAILTGASGNFSSGADLHAMAGEVDPGSAEADERIARDPAIIWRGLLKQDRPTKPLVAAVEGVAIAGGTELLQGTDVRVAGESARFGVSEARWSIYPMGGSAVRLRRQIPYTVAADLLLTGRHIPASAAKEIGLVARVVPDGHALATAREIADTVAANGPLAVEAILRTLRETQHMSEPDAFAHEAGYAGAVMASADAREGPLAFAEKRAPRFRRR